MIRWIGISSAIVILIMVGILAVREQDSSETDHRKKVRVAAIMTGAGGDHSWNESHYEALEKVADSLNLEMAYYENVPEDSAARSIMEKAIQNGAKIIIANSNGYGNVTLEVARRHPEVSFLHATGVRTASNLSTFFGRIYQMRYLSGMVAGAMTKTNKIGYVAAFNYSEVNRGINAFALGVQKVNPDAKVYVSWSNSWGDESTAADATRDLIDKHHIDVLTVHVNSFSPYEIADEKNIWIVGYNRDNSTRFPKHFLTAPVWRWEVFYEQHINDVLQGKFLGRSYWLGLETGMVDLAPMTEHVSDSVRQMVESERERMLHGTFDVFQGPLIDNRGVLRVGKGESMTDEDLLNHFDWYVKGVVDGLKP